MGRLPARSAITLLVLGVAACGDDGEATTTTRAPATDAAAGAAENDAPSESPTGSSSESSPAEETVDGASIPESVVDETVVETLVDETVDQTLVEEVTNTIAVTEVSEECSELVARLEDEELPFEDIDEILVDIKDFTPDEIDADIDTLLASFAEVSEIVDENGGTYEEAIEDPDVAAQIQALGDDPKAEEAFLRVEAYFSEACPALVE